MSGTDTATPVTDDLGPKDVHFTGRVKWVQIDLGEDADGRRPPHLPRGALPDRHGPPFVRPLT